MEEYKAIADKDVLKRVPGLSDVVLQKYRKELKKAGLLKTRERLIENRDLSLLQEIVKTKQTSPSLFFNRIIETVVGRYVAKEKFQERVFSNDYGDKINTLFLEICKEKGMNDESVDDFFCHLNAISDFLSLLGEEDVKSTFNGFADLFLGAIASRKLCERKEL